MSQEPPNRPNSLPPIDHNNNNSNNINSKQLPKQIYEQQQYLQDNHEDNENQFHEMSTAVNGGDEAYFRHLDDEAIHVGTQANYQEQLSAKIKYYNTLLSQNRQMQTHIQSLNKELDIQLQQICLKKYTPTAKYKPYIKPQRSSPVQQKYREMDQLKSQLRQKQIQKKSIAELICRYDNLRAVYKDLFTQVEQKSITLRKLKEMIQKKDEDEALIQNNSLLGDCANNVCKDEIKYLKEKIRVSAAKIMEQKQKFINEYSQCEGKKITNAYKKYKESQTLNKSSLGSKIKTQQLYNGSSCQAQSTAEQELKKQYQELGKRIQVLKNNKKSLLKLVNRNDDKQQRKKYLQKLKIKYNQIIKL